ncbi:MAG: DUF2961 domain-containing protein [Pirellulales bacterium]|nr:DUF2961 domain-containing protein [Pirellulales bacterium]
MKLTAFLALSLTLSGNLQPLSAADLEDLATMRDLTSHRASSHDRTGGNDDNVTALAPGATHVLLDTAGPGRINHIWFTVSYFRNHSTFLRDLVVRIYWEGSKAPSVEVPLGDFFALGHAKTYRVRSAPVAVGYDDRALNCYWPMPFHKHARVELYNNGRRSLRRIYYNLDYELGPIGPDQALFHAMYRRDRNLRTQVQAGNTTGKDNYVILDTSGRGQYVGCVLSVDAQPGGWWGEGDEMIFIDGEKTPSIIGTGSEDYFCDAWGFDAPYSYPFYGVPLLKKTGGGGGLTTAYRWHIPDPVRFTKHIRVTMEHVYKEGVVNDYTTVAYWYQDKPIARRDPLPVAEKNHPRQPPAKPGPTTFDLLGSELEPIARVRGLDARMVTTGYRSGFAEGGYLRIAAPTGQVEVPIRVPRDGDYRVLLKPANTLVTDGLKVTFRGAKPHKVTRSPGDQGKLRPIDLGAASSKDKMLVLIFEGNPVIGLDLIQVRPAK